MGQRRRALLAAAWIDSPEFLILDEPLEAMDRVGRDQIVDWVGQQIERGGTILLATHEIEPFVGLGARILAVRAGEVTVTDLTEVASAERLAVIDALAR